MLGAPGVERNGLRLPPPRGRKTWALLTYLLLSERPQPRSRVASLLFPGAEDPLGAAGDREAALAQVEAGEAALEAGAVEPGIEILRTACAEAGGRRRGA